LLLVEAQIDGQIGNLIFDTGASGFVLNRTYFRDHVQVEDVTPGGITGSVGQIPRVLVDSLSISDLTYCKVRADLADLGHLENRRGIKILGLLGFKLLRNFEIIIDVGNGQLHLYRTDRKGNCTSQAASWMKPQYVQSIYEKNNIVFVTGEVQGRKLEFCFDTGAEINAISVVSPKTVLNSITITRRSKLLGSGSVSREVLYGTMNDLSFGGYDISGMETIITSLWSLEQVYDKQFDGVLGFDFLAKGIIRINLRKRQMAICFNNTVRL